MSLPPPSLRKALERKRKRHCPSSPLFPDAPLDTLTRWGCRPVSVCYLLQQLSIFSAQEEKGDGSEHLGEEDMGALKAEGIRRPVLRPETHLLNIAVSGLPHVVKLDYAGK